MASETQVREFLAHWFQLGKPIVLQNGKAECLPYPIFHGNRYSQAFEECWQHIMYLQGEGCYLKGTDQTIAMMLSPAWEMMPCARCNLPVPVREMGVDPHPCPCHDLNTWPNYDVPMPRLAVDSHSHLDALKKSLGEVHEPKDQDFVQRRPYEPAADVTKLLASWREMS